MYTELEHRSKKSNSDVFNFTEQIKIRSIPVYFKVAFDFFEHGALHFLANFDFGFFYTKISLNSIEGLDSDAQVSMNSNGFLMHTGIASYYRISDNISLFSLLNFRMLRSSDFKYTTEGIMNNYGETVIFADGRSLTLNLTGLKFTVGIKFKWGIS